VLSFDFLDPPSEYQIFEALYLLAALGALYTSNDSMPSDKQIGSVTQLGIEMSQFPLEPTLSRMLIEASREEYSCFDEVSTIVSMMSVENIWIKRSHGSLGKEEKREQQIYIASVHAKLYHISGDHLTYLNIFNLWEKAELDGGSSERAGSKWCQDNYIHHRALKTARSIKQQLLQDASKSSEIGKDIRRKSKSSGSSSSSRDKRILDAIAAGLFLNAGRFDS
jgi:HrpA-like RNA helicase